MLGRILQNLTFVAVLMEGTCFADPPVSQGLAAHYLFEGGLEDISGNANHGHSRGGVTFGADRFLRASRSLRFDGTGSVSLGMVLPSNPASFSQSAWVKSPAVGDGKPWNPPILTRRQADGDDWIHFEVNPDTPATTLNWGYDHAGWKSETSRFMTEKSLSSAIIDLNVWNHLVAVKDGLRIRVYLNGSPYYECKYVNPISGSSSPFTLGYHGAWNRYFSGQIDDVRIYNRALTDDEVARLNRDESFEAPRTAAVTGVVTEGYLTGVAITDPGSGYTAPPSVRLLGGEGSGATAMAIVTGGRISQIIILSAGSGYKTSPRILIESPPFLPQTDIKISKILVTHRMRVNHNYVLESSTDLVTWVAVGPVFTAESETVAEEHSLTLERQYFRLREVP